MRKKQLGQTGVQVGAMCFGAMRCGTSNDWDSSVELLDMFVEAGGDFIDTANIYAAWIPGGKGGESEEVLGRWMKQRRNREGLLIATKVGFGYQDVQTGLPAATIEQECERSLQRMGIETIDLFYAHTDDPDTPQDEVMAAFDRLVKAGKVRLIGASNFAAWRLADAEAVCKAGGFAPYCCVQQRYTYLRPKAGASFGPQVVVDGNLLDFCAARGMTLLPYSPLLGGGYTREDKPIPQQYVGADSDARLSALRAVADETGATVHQVIFAWMMQHEQSVLPVFSASNAEQMRENLGALDVSLTDDQVTRLNDASA
jgi:aryl-alcohol dehydrogenase-like predicted oxidoreductase